MLVAVTGSRPGQYRPDPDAGRNSQKFLDMLESLSGKQSTLPAVDLCTPTRSDYQIGSLNLHTVIAIGVEPEEEAFQHVS